jgi:hypothetical protein
MTDITVTDSKGREHTLRNPRDRKIRAVSILNYIEIPDAEKSYGKVFGQRGGIKAAPHADKATAERYVAHALKHGWATEGEVVTVEGKPNG